MCKFFTMLKMKMLGRRQSLRGEPTLTDYGPDEISNESSEIEWVNKVWNYNMLLGRVYFQYRLSNFQDPFSHPVFEFRTLYTVMVFTLIISNLSNHVWIAIFYLKLHSFFHIHLYFCTWFDFNFTLSVLIYYLPFNYFVTSHFNFIIHVLLFTI